MKISNPWKTAWKAALAVCWIVMLFAMAGALVGCASVDGRIHTPLVALQYDRAIRAAEEAGAVRAKTETGSYRWLAGVEARKYRAARDAALDAGDMLPTVQPVDGQTAEAIRAQYYGWGWRAGAVVGDGAILGVPGYLLYRASDNLNDNGGGSDAYRDHRAQAVTISGSNNNVNLNISQYGGPQSSGDAAPAEEGGAE